MSRGPFKRGSGGDVKPFKKKGKGISFNKGRKLVTQKQYKVVM